MRNNTLHLAPEYCGSACKEIRRQPEGRANQK